FAIDANTGVVTVAAAIDREADGASLNVTVQAKSADGSTASQKIGRASCRDSEYAATAPVDSNATDNAADENAAIGTEVGLTPFAADDGTRNDAVTCAQTGAAASRFAIDANTGVVTVAAAIDREADGASLNVTVQAKSADGSTASQ